MSCSLTCRYCDEEFTPQIDKQGYYDVCERCTRRQLTLDPDIEPELLKAGTSIDEAGTFVELVVASKAWVQGNHHLAALGNSDEPDFTGGHKRVHKTYQPPK